MPASPPSRSRQSAPGGAAVALMLVSIVLAVTVFVGSWLFELAGR